MKKRILSAVLLSGIALSTLSNLTLVSATDYEAQIAAKEAAISSLSAEQSAAKAQVDSIKAQVTSLQAEKTKLEEENKRLEEESQQLIAEIKELSDKIIARTDSLKEQARSAQKNSGATNYISAILDADSISDAIGRVVAIREVVSANESMLKQQEEDKASLQKKQEENQKAINTVWENQKTLAANEVALKTQQAELEVAQINLAAQLTTAEGEKAALLQEKANAEAAAAAAAAAEKAAREAAAREAAAQAQAVPQVQAATSTAVASTTPTATVATTETAASSNKVTYSANNTYPVGQCTWGAKSLAPWVGNYWGNAAQWLGSARAAGYATGTTPQVGAVAVWTNSYYGHVAVVTAINGSEIQVMESNYGGNMSIGNYRGWFNASASGIAGYIYP
ncbi:peptidoglycan hydrolase PcsB [Streptococcus plurextorum]|uniref:peptidoglycan hydrolase PcsB n=1 Tax=Streptococcus plurextorum TaxID=456876 RepID=UPI0004002647|nr:CHAP domain-containing protein [Streptococcus plurextorum]